MVNGSGSTVYYAHGQSPTDMAVKLIEWSPFVQVEILIGSGAGSMGLVIMQALPGVYRDEPLDTDTYIGRSDQLYYDNGSGVMQKVGIRQVHVSCSMNLALQHSLPADAQLVSSGSIIRDMLTVLLVVQ